MQQSPFGVLLRRYMQQREIGLERLAQLADVSKKTLHNWLRPGGVQRPYAWQPIIKVARSLELSRSELVQLLAAAEQPSLEHLYLQATPQTHSLLAPWPRETPHSLPHPLTPLLGRSAELHLLASHLQTQRLITLTGAGGSGKTHLALTAGWAARERFPDGVWWIDLRPVTDPAYVMQAIAHALGRTQTSADQLQQQLATQLKHQHTLLLLDNFEQVVEATAALHTLLDATEQLVILVTSRVRLKLPAEHVITVEPLHVPVPQATHATIKQNPAFQLLDQRLQAVRPSAETPELIDDLATLCRLGDGLPLALELLGSLFYTQSPHSLAGQLDSARQQLINASSANRPHHQRTIAATIHWSYNLLPAQAQTLLLQLAPFVGGCTGEQVQQLATIRQLDHPQNLHALLEHHLLQRTADQPDHYTMLVPIQEWALQELAARQEQQLAYATYTTMLEEWLEITEAKLCGEDQHAALASVAVQHPNLQAALRWSSIHAPAQALHISGLLAEWWAMQGFIIEGRAWLEAVLAHTYPDHPTAWARALYGAGLLARMQSDYAQANQWLHQALVLWRQQDNHHETARTEAQRAMLAQEQGQYTSAQALLQTALAYYETVDNLNEISKTLSKLTITSLNARDAAAAQRYFAANLALGPFGDDSARAHIALQLGSIAHAQGAYPEALQAWQQSLDLYQKLGDRLGITSCLNLLATVQLDLEEPTLAYSLFRQSLGYAQRHGHRTLLIENLRGLGIIAGMLEQWELVAYLATHIEQQQITTVHTSYRQERFERTVAQAQTQLGQLQWFIAHASGTTLPLDTILAMLEKHYITLQAIEHQR